MRLQLLVPIFCYSCFCFHFLLLVSSTADSGDDGLNACVPSTCANLKNVTFPFGAAPSCAASPSFLLSNCTTKQAYWNNFRKAILLGDGAEPPLGPPAVLGISSLGFTIGRVSLTWNRNLIDQNEEAPSICTPAPYSNISDYLPYAINLTVFEDPVFVVSPTNIYLLFNCTNLTSLQSPDFDGRVERNNSNCRSFQTQCKLPDINPNYCLQLQPYNQLMLKHVMERLSCTQFQFFAAFNNSSQFPFLPLKEWRAGIVQLEWTNSQCANCEESNGTCKYDQHNNFECSINVAECNFDNLCSTGSKLAIAGVALSLAFVFHGACLLCIFCKSRSRRQITETDMISVDLNGVCERPMEFSYTALASATASFSTVLGEGGFGVVYKGTVEGSGHTVAVKVLEAKSRHSRGQFLNEVTTIGNIHHVNVVRLLGFCVEKSHKILVYEFVANGSLDQWLFKGGGSGKSLGALRAHLDWRQRYAIAVGIARGLCYLHEECRHRIVHCDIKPQNILLDGQMQPKIADFGLAKLMSRGESQVVTLARGTPGYVAPEFWTGGESLLSSKFDVYSYGMVLLELMSGRRNFVNHCFPAMAFDAAMEEDFKSILDESITKEIDGLLLTSIEWQQVRIATFVALWCIQDHPARRPSMSEVVQYLGGVAAISEQPPRPAIASTTLYPDSPLIRSHFDP